MDGTAFVPHTKFFCVAFAKSYLRLALLSYPVRAVAWKPMPTMSSPRVLSQVLACSSEVSK